MSQSCRDAAGRLVHDFYIRKFNQKYRVKTAPRPSACVVWFTGLPGAGKTTIARLALQRLHAEGCPAILLDGDEVRKGLSSDLGFSIGDRSEHLRRSAEVAALLADAGLIVLCAFVTPLAFDRERIRRRLKEHSFIEAFVSTPLAIAEQRDPKGLYRRARKGEIAEFTGINSPYEIPQSPELTLDTTTTGPTALAFDVAAEVHRRISGTRVGFEQSVATGKAGAS